MDLVERYLNAVAAQLPKAVREDIVAELRDEIMGRLDALGGAGWGARRPTKRSRGCCETWGIR